MVSRLEVPSNPGARRHFLLVHPACHWSPKTETVFVEATETGMHRDSDSRENQRDGVSRRVLCRSGHLRDRTATPCCSAIDRLVEPWSPMTVDYRGDCGEASHLACDSRSRMPQRMHCFDLRRRVAADRPRWLLADKRPSGVRIRMMSARAGPATGCGTRRSAATPMQVRTPGQGRTPLGFM